jgi:hypothetical protein
LGFVQVGTLSFGMSLNVGLHLLCSHLNSIKTLNIVNMFKIKFKVHLNIGIPDVKVGRIHIRLDHMPIAKIHLSPVATMRGMFYKFCLQGTLDTGPRHLLIFFK